MIINTGMRTDIPAFYSKWLLNRIREGFVFVRNPYYKNQVTKYLLDPSVVDILAFCTKNPHPLINYLRELDKFRQFWFITITPYDKSIEPNVPDKKQVIEDFKILSSHIGKNAVSLRYDPILITDKYGVDMHIKCFDKLLFELKDYTNSCIISFLDMYENVKKNAKGLRPPNKEEQIKIAEEFGKIGKKYGIKIYGCLEDKFLEDYGIDARGCMTKEILEYAIDEKLNVKKVDDKNRGCNCVLGHDIGEYNTCMHLCKYCYANANMVLVKRNYIRHIETSPFLIGDYKKDDVIKEAKQESFIENNSQISFL